MPPELVWLAGAAGVDPRPDRVPASTLEAPLWRDSVMYLEQYGDFWHYAQNGKNLGLFCVGAAQLDMYGNANNSIIGDDYHRPKVRLPGTAGLGDMGSLGKRLFYWNPNHSPRSIVEKVDFRLGRRVPRRGQRARGAGADGRAGARRHEPGRARLPSRRRSGCACVSVHPGTTVEQVQEATGFELLLPDGDVPETAAPTAEQVRMLREDIDPDGMCKREAGVKS